MIHLHFTWLRPPPDEQFDFVAVLWWLTHQLPRPALAVAFRTASNPFEMDSRLSSRVRLVVGVNHVTSTEKPWHVLNEEVDCPCHLSSRNCGLEDCGTLSSRPDDFDVGFVHHGFSTSFVPSLRRAAQRLCPCRFPVPFCSGCPRQA